MGRAEETERGAATAPEMGPRAGLRVACAWLQRIAKAPGGTHILQATGDGATLEDLLAVDRSISPVDLLEREELLHALQLTDDKVESARRLGIGRATLYRRLARYDRDGRLDLRAP